MPTICEISLATAVLVKSYANKLLVGIKPEDFAKKPEVNGKLIETNHPAFIYGHLSLYPNRLSKLLNLGLTEFEPSEKYFNMFCIGAKCEHDPENKIYPSMKDITDFYFEGTEKLNNVLKNLPDSVMLSVNTDEKSKERFPLLGGFVSYLIASHPNLHLGQVSVWRRCMGLGSA